MQTNEYQRYLSKAMHYCSKYESCTADVIQKLEKWQCPSVFVPQLIQNLKTEQFLDDTRFAVAFAADKWRFNKWGKQKIEMHLRQKKIPDAIISQSLDEIEQTAYIAMINKELVKKWQSLSNETDQLKRKQKLLRFAAGRGYAPDLVYNWLDNQ